MEGMSLCHMATYLHNVHNHEETETLMSLNAVDAEKVFPGRQILVYSTDSTLVLLIRRSTEKQGEHSRKLKIRAFYNTLGPNVNPYQHSILSDCDTTGKVEGIGKTTWFKTLLKSDENTISALGTLGFTKQLDDDVFSLTKSLLCKCYATNNISTRAEARWFLFAKTSKFGSSLPPTKEA